MCPASLSSPMYPKPAADFPIYPKFGTMVHYGLRDYSTKRMAERAASSGNAALIATFSGIICLFLCVP